MDDKGLDNTDGQQVGVSMIFQVVDLCLLVVAEITYPQRDFRHGDIQSERMPQAGSVERGGEHDIMIVVAF